MGSEIEWLSVTLRLKASLEACQICIPAISDQSQSREWMKEESKFKLMGYTTFLWTVPIIPGNGGKFDASNMMERRISVSSLWLDSSAWEYCQEARAMTLTNWINLDVFGQCKNSFSKFRARFSIPSILFFLLCLQRFLGFFRRNLVFPGWIRSKLLLVC